MDLEEKLRSYTKDEYPIHSKNDYKQMLQLWSNDEDMTVYRGINFSDQEGLKEFLSDFDKNGGYIQGSAAGFAKSLETATDFASTTKTYFPTLEVMQREELRRTLFEEITGIGGVIITAKVKKGEVIDIEKSGQSIEDEVLFAPGTLIKGTLTRIKTFKDLINEPNFNINKYMMSHNVNDDKLAKYIVANHGSELSTKVKDKLVQDELDYIKDVINENWKTDKYKNASISLLDSDQYWLTYSREEYDFSSSTNNHSKHKTLHFVSPSFDFLDKHGALGPKQVKTIKKIAENIIYSALETHLQYRDKMKIDYSNLRHLTSFTSKHLQNMYQRAVNYNKRNQYETLNENLRKIYSTRIKDRKPDLKAAAEEIEKIKQLLISVTTESAQTKRERIEDNNNYRERRSKILSKNSF